MGVKWNRGDRSIRIGGKKKRTGTDKESAGGLSGSAAFQSGSERQNLITSF